MIGSMSALRSALVAAILLAAGCGDAAGPAGRSTASPTAAGIPTPSGVTASPSPSPTPSPTASPSPTPSPSATAVEVRYRIDRRTSDAATDGFAAVVEATLEDPRGWQQAGYDFVRDDADAPYVIVLAEGPEVDELCLPYDTSLTYSCQNGPVVALNADRWRGATPEWTGDLDAYRQMLVNHEVGHLIHLHHPVPPQCPEPGEPAPVMAQQSTELGGCLPNPWPLPWELELAGRHAEPLAPPASHDPDGHRPTPP